MKSMKMDFVREIADCVLMCNHCFDACLGEKDVMMMTECIKLCKECAEICNATMLQVYSGSHFQKEVLTLCQAACEKCAAECRKHPMDHCQECADTCEKCAAACRKLLS